MKKFVSLSQFPGTTGKHYYSKFFQKYNLDYVYEPRGSHNLEKDISLALNQGVSGISISMPYKIDVIQYLDVVDSSTKDYNLCNTIVVQYGKLIGYNSDLYGAQHITQYLKKTDNISILGNGSISQMFQRLLSDYKFTVYSRNLGNWDHRYQPSQTIINCTALGTSSYESPFESLPPCNLVIDMALKPNLLMIQCQNTVTKYLSGLEFYKYQFLKQFELYTNISINEKEFDSI